MALRDELLRLLRKVAGGIESCEVERSSLESVHGSYFITEVKITNLLSV